MAQVNLQALGNAIRAFREAAQPKKVSQFQLATRMQWEGTAPIIEIEKGRRLPRPETINALGAALRLSPADIAYLHGLAGYREATAMPPVEVVRQALEAISGDLALRLYPVYVMDYQFQHWMVNGAVAALFGESLDGLKSLLLSGVHGFNVVFDTRLPMRGYFIDPETIERERIYRFKAHNLYRRHEAFYNAYPERMRDELLPADYARFAACWDAVHVRPGDNFPINPGVTLHLGGEDLTFTLHVVELLQLDRLVFVTYFEPSDDAANRQRCEAYFSQHAPQTKTCIHAWD